MDILGHLCQWVVQNLEAGASEDRLAQALVALYGYNPVVARRVVAQARQGTALLTPDPQLRRPDVARTEEGDARNRVESFDGWQTDVVMDLYHPHILVFRSFAPADVVGRMLENADAWRPQGCAVDGYRTSTGGLLASQALAEAYACAVSRALNWPAQALEPAYVHAYEAGQKFGLHYDFFNPAIAEHRAIVERKYPGNHRIGTFILYLEAAHEGGGTYFANLGLRVQLAPGDAVYFGYPVGEWERSGTLHAGEPVRAGRKKVATVVFHEKPIDRAAAAAGGAGAAMAARLQAAADAPAA